MKKFYVLILAEFERKNFGAMTQMPYRSVSWAKVT
jgi:hypothetical protein